MAVGMRMRTLDPASADQLDACQRGYPRPQLRRATWISLNGEWDFALDEHARWRHPTAVAWSAEIQVPFAPEAEASGIGHTGFFRACWYRRVCHLPPHAPGERWLLHFGAVDCGATVWVNGAYVGAHE